jgi:biotin carboxylase
VTTVRVLLIEAAGPESTALVKTASARGYEVHVVTQHDRFATYSAELRTMLSGWLLTHFSQAEQALNDVIGYARRVGIDAVLTTNEYLTPLVADVCAALGLPGNDPALATTARNKADMVREFVRRGVTAPHTHIVEREDELLGLCAAGLTFPSVVKPAEAAGSAGVTVAGDAAEMVTAFKTAQEPRGMYGMLLDPRVLVQEYIEGTEYSVESITQNGASTHLCLTRKIVTVGAHRVELGHGLPTHLPPDVQRAVHQEVDRAITAAGIRNGAAHTEVMLTPDGRCVVIEIGARIGAGQIGVLIQHALGIDPWAACIDTALGRSARLTPTHSSYATVRFLISHQAGRLVTLSGLPELSPRVPIVRVRKAVGETVNGAKDNAARLGSFVVVGPDRESVDDYANHLLDQVRIAVEPTTTNSHRIDR